MYFLVFFLFLYTISYSNYFPSLFEIYSNLFLIIYEKFDITF